MQRPGNLVFNPKRFVPPLVLGLLAIGYMIIATGFGDATSMAAPLLYGTTLLLLSIVVFVIAFIPGTESTARPGRTARHEEGGFQWRPTALIFLLTGLFIALVFIAGFYVAIPLFLLVFLKFVSKTGWLSAVITSIVALFFTWAVFSYFLHLEVYSGYLHIRV
jgi:magnesium-transporting ATPase (P-type)